jgi:hypothetical protein
MKPALGLHPTLTPQEIKKIQKKKFQVQKSLFVVASHTAWIQISSLVPPADE